jgi:hypothetical protein
MAYKRETLWVGRQPVHELDDGYTPVAGLLRKRRRACGSASRYSRRSLLAPAGNAASESRMTPAAAQGGARLRRRLLNACRARVEAARTAARARGRGSPSVLWGRGGGLAWHARQEGGGGHGCPGPARE